MPKQTQDLWTSFAVWYYTPERLRGEITTEAAWARANGVTDRTVRRWKSDPRFALLMEVHAPVEPPKKYSPPAAAPTAVATVDEDDGEEPEVGEQSDEASYREVKAALITNARSGNPKYIDLYFKTYGKPFVEEEVAARSADLSGMDLEDLVSRALVALGPEPVAQYLRSQGWAVSEPSV